MLTILGQGSSECRWTKQELARRTGRFPQQPISAASCCEFVAPAPEIDAKGERCDRQADAEFSRDPLCPACVDGAPIEDPDRRIDRQAVDEWQEGRETKI